MSLIEHVTHDAIAGICTRRALLYLHSLVLYTTRKMYETLYPFTISYQRP